MAPALSDRTEPERRSAAEALGRRAVAQDQLADRAGVLGAGSSGSATASNERSPIVTRQAGSASRLRAQSRRRSRPRRARRRASLRRPRRTRWSPPGRVPLPAVRVEADEPARGDEVVLHRMSVGGRQDRGLQDGEADSDGSADSDGCAEPDGATEPEGAAEPEGSADPDDAADAAGVGDGTGEGDGAADAAADGAADPVAPDAAGASVGPYVQPAPVVGALEQAATVSTSARPTASATSPRMGARDRRRDDGSASTVSGSAARTCPRSGSTARRPSRPAACRGSSARRARPSTGAARRRGSPSRR